MRCRAILWGLLPPRREYPRASEPSAGPQVEPDAPADAKEPRSWSIRAEYADYLVTQKRYREALAEYEAVLQRSPPKPARIQKRVEQLRKALGSR